MAEETISVGLHMKNEALRSAFEAIVAEQSGFRIINSATHGAPQLLILEMNGDRRSTFAFIQSLLSTSPATEIFLTAPSPDSDVLLEAMRAGVKEFIPQTMQQEELPQALKRFQERHRHVGQTKKGKLINIMGSKGGIGTTTIAVNLATSLREAHKEHAVVLVDLNTPFGDAALFLDIDPAHTIGDVAKNISRLDVAFLMSAVTRHPSGLYLLPSAQIVEEINLLTPESVERTLTLLQTSFDYIILDSGHLLDDITIATLNIAPSLYLVCSLTLPSLRNTKRFLEIFSNVGYSTENIEIIVNRYKSKNKEIFIHDFESVLKKEIFWKVPNDYFTTLTAINMGKPVSDIAKRSKIAKSFKNLGLSICQSEKIREKFLGIF